jgi:hypothetical protein
MSAPVQRELALGCLMVGGFVFWVCVSLFIYWWL